MPQPTGPRPATKTTSPRLKRSAPQPAPTITLQEPPTIPLPVPIHRYRVLFSDGQTIDFLAYSDHSGIRGDMLDAHFGKDKGNPQEKRIEGIAHLGIVYTHMPATSWPEPAPPNPPAAP